MYRSIRAIKADQLITVGQDEAAGGKRPHPHFTQEVGIMNVNYPTGKGKLTEAYTRNLLERKYAFAFAGDNAGSVQWVWNINIHIDNINECTIGAVRPDGGQKLESDISYDEFWGKVEDRSNKLGIETTLTAVFQEENMVIDGEHCRATFRDLKKNWVDKEVEQGANNNDLKVIEYGQGKIIWSPLPLEMNEQNPVIEKAYAYVMEMAGVTPDFTWQMDHHHGIFGKKLKFKKGNLYVFVSELGKNEEVEIKDDQTNTSYKFTLPAQRIMMFATDETGTVVKTYKDWAVEAN